jgi:hypothetical protein
MGATGLLVRDEMNNAAKMVINTSTMATSNTRYAWTPSRGFPNISL